MKANGKIAILVTLACVILKTPVSAGEVSMKDVSIRGFVDTSYSANLTTGQTTFTLDQFEVDVEKKMEGIGALRVDVNFAHSSDDDSTPGVDEGRLTASDVLEQGFVSIDTSFVSLMLGKFNAPIGFELLDAPDMYQFSHAMVFDFGLPTNLTGVNLTGSFGIVDLSASVSNGWDNISDDNNEVTIGGRLGLTPLKGLNFGVSYIVGDETGGGEWTSAESLSVFDVDLTFTMVPNLTVGAEFNSGIHEKNSGLKPGVEDAKWMGYLLMANYVINDAGGLTLRYDSFKDSEGARLSREGGAVDETRHSFTISPSLSIGDGFLGLIEYRYTISDQEVFLDSDGERADHESSFALELTYSF